jgi:O-antigen ligase/Tfp pilus assembly protein PilF
MSTLKYPKPIRQAPSPRRTARATNAHACWDCYKIGRIVLFAHLLLSPLLFHPESLEVFEYNKVALLRGAGIVLLGLGLAAWIARPWSAVRASLGPVVRDPIVWGIVLFLLSAILSTITSISPRTSFWGAHESYAGLFTVFAYTVLFFGTMLLCRTAKDCRRLTLAPALGAVAASVYALLQVAHLDPVAWQRVSDFNGYVRPFATLGHPNLLAGYLVMTAPFLFDRFLKVASKRRWALCAAWGTGTALAVVVIGLSLSRGAWLALSTVALVLAIGWGWFSGKRRIVTFCTGGLVGVVCLLGVVARLTDGGIFPGPLRERCCQLLDAGPRQYIWDAGLAIFRENPIWGSGLDTFQLAFPPHRNADFCRVEWNQTPIKAHNELIHILATQGIIGGIAIAMMIGGLCHAFFQAWRNGRRNQRAFLLAVAAGGVGFFVQAFFSFTVAGIGTLFVTLMAIIVRLQFANDIRGRTESFYRAASRRSWVAAARIVVGTATLAGVFVAVIRPWQANVACGSAEALMDEDPRQAVEFAEHALELDGTQDVYWTRLGSAWHVCSWHATDPRGRQIATSRACDAFEQAVQMVPVNAYHHANLGRALGELSLLGSATSEQAYAEFDAALALDGANAYFYADAGQIALRLGDLKGARAYAEKGLELYPDFGPLRALLGYLAIAEEEWQEAALLLTEAVEAEWHGDVEGKTRAGLACNAVRNRPSR